MDEKNIYLMTSCKGGVGKSTVAVNLAMAFALSGKKTLIADCDTKNRAVDLLLGYEDDCMFDLSDVADGKVHPCEAVLNDPRCDALYYTTVSRSKNENISPAKIVSAAIRCADAADAEILIIDTAGDSEFPRLAYEKTQFKAIIVSTPSSTAVRAAEKTGFLLASYGINELYLVINSFIPDKNNRSVVGMIDETRVPLIGIVLFDNKMKAAQEKGKPAASLECSYAPEAFKNIAMRLSGFDIPLFSGIPIKKRKHVLSPPEETESITNQ